MRSRTEPTVKAQQIAMISEDYLNADRELHEGTAACGTSSLKWADAVMELARGGHCTTVLDYGCGKGLLAPCLQDLDVREYDPAIVGKDDDPEAADLVVCTDVLEHIEPELLDNVLRHLRALTKKYLFVNIATRPAIKTLPDGRNAHLIVEPAEWWRARIEPFFEVLGWNQVGTHSVTAVLASLKSRNLMARR